MDKIGAFLLGLVGLIIGALIAGWVVWKTIIKSEDPGRVAYKWVASGVILCILVYGATKLGKFGYAGAFGGPIIAAAFGVLLGALWAPHIGGLIAKPFTSFYDGGEAEPELRPFYSIARAKQKRGLYIEAMTEVHKQLQQFPGDYEGLMLLAEIQGDNLKDNDEAQRHVQAILQTEGIAARNVVFALNRSADWHLQLAGDRETARETLEEIVRRFPESEFAHTAAQRISHLTSDKMLADQRERPTLHLVHHDDYIGLKGDVADPRPAAEDPAAAAGRLVQHLNNYPEDVEAREELAAIYADHYKRLDLAADQIERLISLPGVSQKEIARWLNVLVDFHVRMDGDQAAARGVLERLINMFPKSAVSSLAESRLAYLDGEFRKHKKSQVLKLGSYDDNLGLKGNVPKRQS